MSSVSADQGNDALSRLRIKRTPAAPKRSWFGWLLRVLFVLLFLLVLVAAGIFLAGKNGWLSGAEKWVAVPEMIQSRVEVRPATLSVESGRSADATVVATGYLESRRQAKIGARAPGRIQVVNVEEGSKVTANQELAVLEHADLDASLAAAQASLSRAKAAILEQDVIIQQTKREFDRLQKMWDARTAAEAEYDKAKFAYQAAMAKKISMAAEADLAEARVRESEQMQANMYIRAPFDGTVISKDAEVGESILPGGMGEASGRGSVVTVADLDHLEVDADVKEDYISRIVTGQSAEVAVDAVPDRRYQAKVRKIIPMGDRARATIKVKVEIIDADGRLFPDMSATVYFLPDESAPVVEQPKQRIFCETAAIRSVDGQSFVWVVSEDGRLQRVDVKTTNARDDRTEIVEGLTGDERVIVGPPDLKAGQLVKVAE